jgi:hypothetical protein
MGFVNYCLSDLDKHYFNVLSLLLLLTRRTNMMVYQPGGYAYNNFLFLGSPMQLALWIVSVALLEFTTSSNFYISWFISFLILVLVAFYGIAMEYLKKKIQSRRNDDPTEVQM